MHARHATVQNYFGNQQLEEEPNDSGESDVADQDPE